MDGGKKQLDGCYNCFMVDRATKEIIEAAESGERIFSVSVYLDLLNTGLKTFSAKIRGEVTKVTERGGHRYFSIKDGVDGSILNCIMWKSKYELYGINLSEGSRSYCMARRIFIKFEGK